MRKRRKRRRVRRILRNLLFTVFMLALTAGFVYLIFFIIKNKPAKPKYEYYSMSEEAAARAYVWLNRIDDMPLSYEDIKADMGDIKLKVVLTPAGEKGRYLRTLDNNTFNECSNKANRGLEKAYRDVLKHRLTEDGYEDEISDKVLDELMKEAYGFSVAGYLSQCNIQLIPGVDELNAMYSGEIVDE